MRILIATAILGTTLLSGASPVQAQYYYNTNTATPMAPLYVTPPSQTYYTTQPDGTTPIYNNSHATPLLPMDQMVAGKNAPSYNYGQTNNAYQFGTNNQWYGGGGVITPAQQQQLRQQGLAQQQAQQAQAQALQQQYMNTLAQQQGQPGVAPGAAAMARSIGSPYSQLTGGPFGTAPAEGAAPTQRRVVYKELNDPLKPPARLFNPDQ